MPNASEMRRPPPLRTLTREGKASKRKREGKQRVPLAMLRPGAPPRGLSVADVNGGTVGSSSQMVESINSMARRTAHRSADTLFGAVLRDDATTVQQLSKVGVAVLHVQNENHLTALQLATEHGSTRVLACLRALAMEAGLQPPPPPGRSPARVRRRQQQAPHDVTEAAVAGAGAMSSPGDAGGDRLSRDTATLVKSDGGFGLTVGTDCVITAARDDDSLLGAKVTSVNGRACTLRQEVLHVLRALKTGEAAELELQRASWLASAQQCTGITGLQ